ncbi:DUF4253 domain-containing protein [Micromonospora cathayae]|uniref:DUF4253 domain-containing protein n=1 Tax=Micromonospora cathayae TaxID=3028804 RepID=A0ABY7ZQB1_9ACTN|nr:DUF4253 domain-containing protein [Micromonospora sp. HUAS 3]WDZ85204.1 DUF4253 domain-containing protein [Micromonospora sp. HUAS 3]
MHTDLPRLLAALPPEALPPGRLVTPEVGGPPAYWLSDAPAEAYRWTQLRRNHPETGLWPLLLTGLRSDEDRPWVVGEVSPTRRSAPERHDPAELLAQWWHDGVTDEDEDDAELGEATAPFGRRWPGLAAPGEPQEPPGDSADGLVDFLAHEPEFFGEARLGLVAATRSADTLAVVGWSGSANHICNAGQLSAVLRSWEQRYGAQVVAVGFDTLHLSVAAPPTTTEHAVRVAAEHHAFCPDNVHQGSGSLAAYAEEIRGSNSWSFWWD